MKIVKRLPLVIVVLLLLLIPPQMSSRCQPPGMNCTSDSHHCVSDCCLGIRQSWQGTGCTLLNNAYCGVVWNTDVHVSCPSGGCIVNFNKKQCTFLSGPPRCRLDDSYEQQGCCFNPSPTPVGSNPTATNAPSRTPTRTATPTQTPTPTATPIPPVAELIAQYSSLALRGPLIGQPSQTLIGSWNTGAPNFTVAIYVQDPSGLVIPYTQTYSSLNFRFAAAQAGDTFFGTSRLGTWRAWFTVQDRNNRTITSNTVTWWVAFYAIHEKP
jgi:hypothetical protein